MEDETSFSADEDYVNTVVTKAKLTANKKRNITIIVYHPIYIKSFPGAKIECMTDYVKPSIKYNPDVLLLHCGTNDLRSRKDATDLTNDIITLANNLKQDDKLIIISGLIERKDKWNEKGKEVNIALKLKCAEKNIILQQF